VKSRHIVITGAFDRLPAREIRFLEEASKLGELTALLWSDDLIGQFHGAPPKYPEAERRYCLNAIRFVHDVRVVNQKVTTDSLPEIAGFKPDLWAMRPADHNTARESFCRKYGLACHVIGDDQLKTLPGAVEGGLETAAGRKKVIVTGCFDWFHSGHVRFFEEVSTYGDLYVMVGSDANIHLLKGDGHPLFPQDERRYVVASVRFVKLALVTTGHGWLDADPEIRRLKPDIYAVNEDGDKGGKREYCEKLGIEYLVLKRVPALGLPRRSSTDLRGF
jgi:cytidyltransferase-like protein